jgi:hypothetical protein
MTALELEHGAYIIFYFRASNGRFYAEQNWEESCGLDSKQDFGLSFEMFY